MAQRGSSNIKWGSAVPDLDTGEGGGDACVVILFGISINKTNFGN